MRKRHIFRMALVLCLLWPVTVHSQGWTNPMVLPRLQNRSLGDPYIMKYRGYYYLYVSADDRNIYCWRTKDLMEWSNAYVCCTDETTAVAYAPEVIYWNGKFYMCTSPRGGGHYLLTSDSPTGPFVHQTGNLGRDIDGSMFVNDDGKWYFYHANNAGIHACQMPTHLSFGDDVNLGCNITGQWTEGPCVFKRNNLFYLLYTGNHVWTNGYRINYAISSSGPLSGFQPQNEQNPILVDTETPTHKALGHGTAFVGPDLDTYFFCYHNLQDNKTRRLLNFERIAWNGDKLMMTGPTDWEQDRPLVADHDYFERSDIGERWAMPQGGNWQIEDGDHLAQTDATGTHHALFQSTPLTDFTAEFTLRSAGDATGQFGALFSYQDAYNYSLATINAAEGRFEVCTYAEGEEKTKKTANLPADFDPASWHSIRIEKNGARVCAFIDGMCKVQCILTAEAGRVGYATSQCAAHFGYIALSPYVDGSASLHVSQPLPGMMAANLSAEKNELVTTVPTSMSPGKYNLMRCDPGAAMTYHVNIQSDNIYNMGLRYRSTVLSHARLLLDGKVLADNIELPRTHNVLHVQTLKDIQMPAGHHDLTFELIEGRVLLLEFNVKRGVRNPHVMADNFDDGFSPEWGYREGNWNIVDGQLESTGRYGKMLMGGFDDIHLTDYTVECDVIYSTGDSNGGLLFRTTNASTGGADDNPVLGTDFLQGYIFLAGASSVTLGKHNFGWQALTTVSRTTDLSMSHHMKVEVENATIRCYLDDMEKPIITYTDPAPFITGRAGFRAHDSVMRFDNLVVTPKENIQTSVAAPAIEPVTHHGVMPIGRLFNLLGQRMSNPSASLKGLFISNYGGSTHIVVKPSNQ